mgnify:FL=1
MTTYTPEQKREYYKSLRERWQSIKKAVDEKKLGEIEAIIQEHGLDVSPYSFAFTAAQMEALGYDGLPYLDCKTFQGWKERGFIVRRGERSKITGITWIGVGNKSEDPGEREKSDSGFVMPKEYHLFHRSQVDPLA